MAPPALPRRSRTAAALILAAALAAAGGAAGAPAQAPSTGAPPRQSATAPKQPPADHRQENKALVRRYLTEVMATGNADRLDEIVARTFTDRSAGAAANLHGPDAVREIQKRLHSLFGKLEYDIQDLVAEDDRVAARYVVLATPRPEPHRPPHAPMLLNGLAVFRIRAGRIQEVFVVNDQLGALRQLGYTVVPPGAAPAAPAAAPHTAPPVAPGTPAASPGASLPPSPPPAASPSPPPQASPSSSPRTGR